MRIVIVGTAYPLRGGIAHHISLLEQTLVRRGHDVKVITFKRQYPKFLFPGKSQEEITNDDSDDRSSRITNGPAEQLIDSINPITWMKAGVAAANFKPDLILFKYWIPFFAPAYGVLARTAKRLTRKHGRECRVAFIVDNVLPHEKRPGDLMLTKFAFRAVDYFIVLSDAVERDLKAVEPAAKIVRLDHPTFENFGPRVDRFEARTKLGISGDAPVILFFGYIRKYKGLDILLRAMPRILERLTELRLIVAGEFYGDEKEYRALIEELRIPAKNLVLATDYIPNDQVTIYFSAANVCVLPYRSATQSGIVLVAYNFDVPAIATNVGGLAEVVKDGESGLIAPEATPESVAEKVIQFFEEGLEEKLTHGVIEEKQKYSWDVFAEGIETLKL
ncbi:MAG TPA: glycosyltransferase family 4 protein [Candidatus Kapabacteria bacterium]|nr:glycosyltransferase family 4 protein [Candidatus Kapabacteria bacterium]